MRWLCLLSSHPASQEIELSHPQTEIKSQEEDYGEAKKPLPDFKKLHEEAIIQQLKIKEFFQPSTSVKKIQLREDLDEEKANNADS